MDEKLFTIKDVAERLRVSAACVYDWVRQHRVAYHKIVRAIRIPESEVRRLMEEGYRPRVDK